MGPFALVGPGEPATVTLSVFGERWRSDMVRNAFIIGDDHNHVRVLTSYEEVGDDEFAWSNVSLHWFKLPVEVAAKLLTGDVSGESMYGRGCLFCTDRLCVRPGYATWCCPSYADGVIAIGGFDEESAYYLEITHALLEALLKSDRWGCTMSCCDSFKHGWRLAYMTKLISAADGHTTSMAMMRGKRAADRWVEGERERLKGVLVAVMWSTLCRKNDCTERYSASNLF
jgi:hypothetical protein